MPKVKVASDVAELLIPAVPTFDNPSLSQTTSSIHLNPIALWPVDTIPSIHHFPVELDISRLVHAIKRGSAIWPTIAGRFERVPRDGKEGEWDYCIRLTSSPIPLYTQTVDASTPFPTRHVVQPTILPYIRSLPSDHYVPGSDSPLLALCLTTLLPSRSQVLGIGWGHILGDASACGHFTRLLSQLYAQPDASLNDAQLPNFFPHIQFTEYPPSEETLQEFVDDPYEAYPPVVASEMYAATGPENADMLVIVLSRKEIKAMKSECNLGGTERLSEQDVLSAWWTVLLEKSGGLFPNARRMAYTVNYRGLQPHHPAFPLNLPNLASNVAAMRSFPLPNIDMHIEHDGAADHPRKPPHLTRIMQIARAIRFELTRMRQDPDYTLRWLSCVALKVEQACIKMQGQYVIPPEDSVLINSNLRFDWNISFGFLSSRTAYFTSYSNVRRMVVHQANPDLESGEVNVELSFNVEKGGIRTKIENAVEEDRWRWAAATSAMAT